MQLTLLKSKIHRATVTGASLNYEGSITISQESHRPGVIVLNENNEVTRAEGGAAVSELQFA